MPVLHRLPWDRWITLALVDPLQRLGLYRPAPGVPILMYHSISDELEPGVPPYYRLNTSPRRFREQMLWLQREGWRVVPLVDAVAQAGSGCRLVALTFDDGYEDFLTHAWPVLAELGYPATVFVATGLIDSGRGFRGKPCLTWHEIEELAAGGVDFGSHTVTHRRLVDLDWEEVRWELAESKTRLEAVLGKDIRAFSLPYAFPEGNKVFCGRLLDMLKEVGYELLVTTRLGRQRACDGAAGVRRLPCSEADDPALFRRKLGGAYDWLYHLQRLRKFLAARGKR